MQLMHTRHAAARLEAMAALCAVRARSGLNSTLCNTLNSSMYGEQQLMLFRSLLQEMANRTDNSDLGA